ncbi:hypothetical protein HPB50_016263 [Hyalomma asiaticum]|uniref:Uncharacterized protein n=1 Tax=Hyalomma asiaticum TaxID=266040 RepID=A0ACB7TLE7_HYAAI|nr:hypothetical protein HPB50_016263 [Hyalomma asiaticum]
MYWNRPFKANLRKSWEEFMRRAERTPKGNLQKPSHQDVLNFMAAAWEAVPEKTVTQSFKGCGIYLTCWMAQKKVVCMAGCPMLAPFLRSIAMGCRPNAAAYPSIQTPRSLGRFQSD